MLPMLKIQVEVAITSTFSFPATWVCKSPFTDAAESWHQIASRRRFYEFILDSTQYGTFFATYKGTKPS